MAAACDRCARAMKRLDEAVTCMGFCDHVAHQRCVSDNKDVVKAISDSPNLYWMFAECTNLMKIIRFRNVVSSLGTTINEITRGQEVANAELKTELAKQREQIAELSKRIGLATPSRAGSNSRRRTEENSQPVKPLLGGTRTTNEVSVTTVPQPNKTLFWIYLSRLHPSVKPEAIEKITKDGLNCESVKAIPLVKKGTDLKSLNFISYKVGVDPKHRTAALDPAMWPEGILFREFEDTRFKNYWMPDPSTPSIIVTPHVEETLSSASASASMDTAEC